MAWLFGWLMFSVVAGAIAGSKGRSGFGYFLLSLLLSPVVGVLLAIGLPGIKPAPAIMASDNRVKCPECRELVLADARKCKHCGSALTPESDLSEEQLLDRYGIMLSNGKYQVGEYRYDSADDALRQAKKRA